MRKLILIAVLVMMIPVRAYAMSDVPVEYEPCTEPSYTSEDVLLLANVIYFENWCNSDRVRMLTGSVVINRMNSKYFPDTVHGVLYQQGQYATTKYFGTKPMPSKAMKMAEMLLKYGSIAPAEVLFQSMQPKLGSKIYYTENGEYFAFY